MLSVLLLTLLTLLSPAYQHPDQVSSRFNRAVELQRQGAWKEAAEEYRAVLSAAPGYAEARANLGVVLSRLGNYEDSVSSYEAALRLNPSLTPILLNLGIAHYQAGQFAKAVEPLERFLAISPNHIQARQLIGISLVELGRERDAISYLEYTLPAAPNDVTVLYSLGMAYLRLGRPELESIMQRLSGLPNGTALARLLQGQSHLESLEIEKAATDLEAAEKLSPELPRLQFLLGLAYFKLGKSADAKVRFERELTRVPTDFLSLYYLALTLEKQGDLDNARQH
jgi:tetratricopeptide (TPR) repeat protein